MPKGRTEANEIRETLERNLRTKPSQIVQNSLKNQSYQMSIRRSDNKQPIENSDHYAGDPSPMIRICKYRPQDGNSMQPRSFSPDPENL